MRRWLLAEHSAQALLREAAKRLADAGIETARLDAEVLLAHVCHIDRLALLSDLDATISSQNILGFQELVARRCTHEPASYITGFAEFWSQDFHVQPGILIPRADSEVLVEAALKVIPQDHPFLFADLGVGSGCLALSILAERPHAVAVGVDVSEVSIEVSKRNAKKLGVSTQYVTQCQPMERWLDSAVDYKLIISNPPYINQRAYDGLEKSVKAFEPRGALVGGQDGLHYYRQLADRCPKVLSPGSQLIVEIGFDQKDAVTALFQPAFQNIRCIKDLAGRDRVIIAS